MYQILRWMLSSCMSNAFPATIYMFKVNTRNTGKMCKIYSKLKIKTRTRRQWHLFGIFIVNFDHILHPFLLFLLHTLGQNEHTMSANNVLIFIILCTLPSKCDYSSTKTVYSFRYALQTKESKSHDKQRKWSW